MNINELQKKHPDAFKALPEPYQADSCLVFTEKEGKLYAEPTEDQQTILGSFVAVFDGEEWFVDIGTKNEAVLG